jgi:hypothetical protein
LGNKRYPEKRKVTTNQGRLLQHYKSSVWLKLVQDEEDLDQYIFVNEMGRCHGEEPDEVRADLKRKLGKRLNPGQRKRKVREKEAIDQQKGIKGWLVRKHKFKLEPVRGIGTCHNLEENNILISDKEQRSEDKRSIPEVENLGAEHGIMHQDYKKR